MALPSTQRLKRTLDFKRAFTIGRALKGALLLIKITPNNLAKTRFGFVVSGKVSGKAVERNRIRRILSECLKNKQKNIKTGYDIAVLVLAGKIRYDKIDLEKELLYLLKKGQVYG